MKKPLTYKVTILAYPGMTMLDAIGPNEVLSNSPHFNVQFVTTSLQNTVNDNQNIALANLPHFSEINDTDILLVPGGPGDKTCMENKELMAWIRDMDKQTRVTASVCTGSLILANAGVLQNKQACTHWACLEELENLGAIPARQRFVQDGKHLTSSGVSAGIDMALYLVKELISKEHAKMLRFGIEYFPNQLNLLSSYTIPRFMLRKLANKVKDVIEGARNKVKAWEHG